MCDAWCLKTKASGFVEDLQKGVGRNSTSSNRPDGLFLCTYIFVRKHASFAFWPLTGIEQSRAVSKTSRASLRRQAISEFINNSEKELPTVPGSSIRCDTKGCRRDAFRSRNLNAKATRIATRDCYCTAGTHHYAISYRKILVAC